MIRRFATSDIHGNFKALKQVLAKANFDNEKDTLIVIGDVCDGYGYTYEVVEQLLKIKNLHFLLGNHDVWFMDNIESGWAERIWTSQGGSETINSYKRHGYAYDKIPKTHQDFFNSAKYYLELDDMLFVHGGFNYCNKKINTGVAHPLDDEPQNLLWDRTFLERCKTGLKVKGWDKIFLGHTTTELDKKKPSEPNIYNYYNDSATIFQIDCGAGWKGRLCMINIDTEEYVLSDYAEQLNGKKGG